MPESGTNDVDNADQDQSMEEILQSIRKIIAEESDDAEGDGAEDGTMVEEADEKPQDAVDISAASEVLELTDVVESPSPDDDGESEAAPDSVAMEPEVKPESDSEPTEETPPVEDILSNIDDAISPNAEASITEDGESLLSEESAAAASAALKSINKLKNKQPEHDIVPSPEFRSGATVEALRPMLKEWLDNNLPVIVERIVEREIRKLT